MKYILLLLILNFTLTGWGQKKDTTCIHNWVRSGTAFFTNPPVYDDVCTKCGKHRDEPCPKCPGFDIDTVIRVPATQFSIVSNAKIILQLNSNGDVYYLPSAFCDCAKCRKYKGMKFLFNTNKPFAK